MGFETRGSRRRRGPPFARGPLKLGAAPADHPVRMPVSAARQRALRAALLIAVALLACAAPPPALADGEPDPPAVLAPAPVSAPPPTVVLSRPTAGANLGVGVATTLLAYAAGDVNLLSLHVDGVPVCVFTRVHDGYACPWTPLVKDLGAHTVEARAQGADGQIAAASAPVVVTRLLPAAIGARTQRKRLRSGGWRLTTTGTVAVPAGLTAAACGGIATVTVLSGRHTLVDRSVPVATDCRFSSLVSLAAPRGAKALKVKVAYGGARMLAPRSAPVQTLSLR
jgi:hypothetical protein